MTPARLLTICLALFIVGLTIWGLGRGIDHMLDPCRTYDLQQMNPKCR